MASRLKDIGAYSKALILNRFTLLSEIPFTMSQRQMAAAAAMQRAW